MRQTNFNNLFQIIIAQFLQQLPMLKFNSQSLLRTEDIPKKLKNPNKVPLESNVHQRCMPILNRRVYLRAVLPVEHLESLCLGPPCFESFLVCVTAYDKLIQQFKFS